MAVTEDIIISSLFFGLNEKVLVKLLQHSLEDYRFLVICWLADLVMLLCSEGSSQRKAGNTQASPPSRKKPPDHQH